MIKLKKQKRIITLLPYNYLVIVVRVKTNQLIVFEAYCNIYEHHKIKINKMKTDCNVDVHCYK